jgi:broad specificity phosphatase PhoE
MPSVVMLIRHAEKPLGDGPPHGVMTDGTPDPQSLTPRGWQRAGALVGLFAPDRPGSRGGSLPTPSHLFASQIGGPSISKRPRETLVPLSERLGLDVDSRFAKEDVDGLVQAVRAIDGVVLIAWEHHVIPSIANLLAADESRVPQIWPDDRYDVVWVFEGNGPGVRPGFRQVPEMLLAGDRPTPIGAASYDAQASATTPGLS